MKKLLILSIATILHLSVFAQIPAERTSNNFDNSKLIISTIDSIDIEKETRRISDYLSISVDKSKDLLIKLQTIKVLTIHYSMNGLLISFEDFDLTLFGITKNEIFISSFIAGPKKRNLENPFNEAIKELDELDELDGL